MILINFGHPLDDEQLVAANMVASESISQVISVATQFDTDRSFCDQAREHVDAVGLPSSAWQTERLLIGLPTLHVGAAAVLAELHGRCGYFPAVLRLKPVTSSVPIRYVVEEIMNLQSARDAARASRYFSEQNPEKCNKGTGE